MILFVFEGSDDSKIMDTIKRVYPNLVSEEIIYVYKNNIYQLYEKMKSSDFTESLLSVLQERSDLKNPTISNANEDTFSQIFLFF